MAIGQPREAQSIAVTIRRCQVGLADGTRRSRTVPAVTILVCAALTAACERSARVVTVRASGASLANLGLVDGAAVVVHDGDLAALADVSRALRDTTVMVRLRSYAPGTLTVVAGTTTLQVACRNAHLI